MNLTFSTEWNQHIFQFALAFWISFRHWYQFLLYFMHRKKFNSFGLIRAVQKILLSVGKQLPNYSRDRMDSLQPSQRNHPLNIESLRQARNTRRWLSLSRCYFNMHSNSCSAINGIWWNSIVITNGFLFCFCSIRALAAPRQLSTPRIRLTLPTALHQFCFFLNQHIAPHPALVCLFPLLVEL